MIARKDEFLEFLNYISDIKTKKDFQNNNLENKINEIKYLISVIEHGDYLTIYRSLLALKKDDKLFYENIYPILNNLLIIINSGANDSLKANTDVMLKNLLRNLKDQNNSLMSEYLKNVNGLQDLAYLINAFSYRSKKLLLPIDTKEKENLLFSLVEEYLDSKKNLAKEFVNIDLARVMIYQDFSSYSYNGYIDAVNKRQEEIEKNKQRESLHIIRQNKVSKKDKKAETATNIELTDTQKEMVELAKKICGTKELELNRDQEEIINLSDDLLFMYNEGLITIADALIVSKFKIKEMINNIEAKKFTLDDLNTLKKWLKENEHIQIIVKKNDQIKEIENQFNIENESQITEVKSLVKEYQDFMDNLTSEKSNLISSIKLLITNKEKNDDIPITSELFENYYQENKNNLKDMVDTNFNLSYQDCYKYFSLAFINYYFKLFSETNNIEEKNDYLNVLTTLIEKYKSRTQVVEEIKVVDTDQQNFYEYQKGDGGLLFLPSENYVCSIDEFFDTTENYNLSHINNLNSFLDSLRHCNGVINNDTNTEKHIKGNSYSQNFYRHRISNVRVAYLRISQENVIDTSLSDYSLNFYLYLIVLMKNKYGENDFYDQCNSSNIQKRISYYLQSIKAETTTIILNIKSTKNTKEEKEKMIKDTLDNYFENLIKNNNFVWKNLSDSLFQMLDKSNTDSLTDNNGRGENK